jgi:hypothetical protein
MFGTEQGSRQESSVKPLQVKLKRPTGVVERERDDDEDGQEQVQQHQDAEGQHQVLAGGPHHPAHLEQLLGADALHVRQHEHQHGDHHRDRDGGRDRVVEDRSGSGSG